MSYSGSSAPTKTYTYDADGNLTGMTDGSGTSSFTYDPFGEELTAANGAGQTVTWAYDSDGNVESTTYPLPGSASWAATDTVDDFYDHADNLTGVTDFNGNRISIGYSPDDLVNTTTLGSTGDKIDTTFDNTDSPSLIKLENSTSTLQSFTYSYAPDETILNETDAPSSSFSPAVYTYDDQGRTTSMTPGSGSPLNYTYDASSNLATLPGGGTGTYNAAGQLTSATIGDANTSFDFDADGQQLNEKQGSTTITAGTWNGANDLTSYDDSSADMTGAVYDGNGMRASTTMTPAGGSPHTESYVWDGDNLLMDATNAYIYTGGTAPAEQVSLSTGAITYLSTDSLGSVRGTISSSGTLTGSTSYDAWGNPETPGGLTPVTPFGFAGGYTDPTGLIYLDNRYYDPGIGQFTSLDPDVDDTGDPYSYAASNPVSETDPSGDDPDRPCVASCGGGSRIPSGRFYSAATYIVGQIQSAIDNTNSKSIFNLTKAGVSSCGTTDPVACFEGIGVWWLAVHNKGVWDFKQQLGPKRKKCKSCGSHDIDNVQAETAKGGGELDWYARVSKNRQIYYNVWANMFYSYVGNKAGFPSWFLQAAASGGGLLGTGQNTPGNDIERDMGFALKSDYSDQNTLDDGDILKEILMRLHNLSKHCDAEPFPYTRAAAIFQGCRNYTA